MDGTGGISGGMDGTDGTGGIGGGMDGTDGTGGIGGGMDGTDGTDGTGGIILVCGFDLKLPILLRRMKKKYMIP